MKNNKKYFIVFSLLIVYVVVMFILVGNGYLKNKKEQRYIIIDQFARWKKLNGKWEQFRLTDTDYFLWKQFDIYDGQEYLGNYSLQYNKRWYVWDKNRNSIDYEEQVFAYRGNRDIKMRQFSSEELNDSDYVIVNNVLKDLKIEDYNELSTSKKYEYDIDSDMTNETFYEISNLNSLNEPNSYFSVLFMKKGNKTIIIEKSIGNKKSSLQLGENSLVYIINLDEEKSDSIITRIIYFSKPEETTYKMYDYNENKFSLIIKN